jgi:hypothetical protein
MVFDGYDGQVLGEKAVAGLRVELTAILGILTGLPCLHMRVCFMSSACCFI